MNDPDVAKMMKLVDLALKKPNYTYPMQLNAPKPKRPFASVKKMCEKNPGRDRVVITEENNVITTVTEGIRLIEFKIIFTEGLEEQTRFQTSFRRQDILDFMTANDLSVLDYSEADNENLTLETNWELRDGIIVKCMLRRTYTQEETIIEETEITGTYNEGNKTLDMLMDVNPI